METRRMLLRVLSLGGVSSALLFAGVVCPVAHAAISPKVSAGRAAASNPLSAEDVQHGPQKVVVADGIFLFISPDIDGIEVDGNSIVVVNRRDLLVFDTNVLPSSARRVLGEIRKITDEPVRYVVNSHWHPDHWDGNEVYAREFPGVEIISSAETRRLMHDTMHVYGKTLQALSVAPDKEMEEALRTGKNSDGSALADKDRHEFEDSLRVQREFMAEYGTMHPVLPSLAFGDALTLYRDGREFRVMHFVGNTQGDTAVYLPKEKILLTGDLLTAPIPFAADSHPRAWIESLKALARLDADVIVPGDGALQRDKTYLQLVTESLQFVEDQVHEALERGMTLDETRKFVKFDALRPKFTHDDANLNAEFDGNFAGPIVRQVYDEATEQLELYQ
jgi:cyclase